MRKKINLGDWTLELGTARHKWGHFKVHRYDFYKHLVWGKISVVFGRPGLEEVTCCPHCYGETQEIGEVTCCEECGCIEDVGAITITMDEWEAAQ